MVGARRWWLALAALAMSVGCLDDVTSQCADGRICPGGTVCDDAHAGCVSPDQLERCAGADDGTACTIGGGTPGICHDEVCLREGCGDGVKQVGEQCDRDDLGDDVTGCRSLGYHEDGPVGCTDACVYDDSQCQHYCGDGILDPPEDCDGELFADVADCTDLGFYDSAPVSCNEICRIDASGCTGFCGDDQITADELCDGDRLGDKVDCADYGYYDPAPLLCTSNCRHDTSHCTGYCGDGMRNGSEYCDGILDTPDSCLDFGFDVGRLDCSGLCAPELAGCYPLGWRQMASPVGIDLWGVWAPSADDAFAVGEDGTILRLVGGNWVTMTSPTSAWLSSVWGTSASDVYAVGTGGVIIHFDGTDWTPMTSFTGNSLYSVHGADGEIFAVGTGGVIGRYDGTSWAVQSSPTSEQLEGVWAMSASEVYAVGRNGTMLDYDGTSWGENLPSPTSDHLWSAWGTGDNLYVSYGDPDISTGGVFRYDGTGWTHPVDAMGGNLLSVRGSGPDNLVAVGFPSVIWQSDGQGWNYQWRPTSVRIGDVWVVDHANAYAVGDDGRVLRYRGLGLERTEWVAGAVDMQGIWGFGVGNAVAVGGNGTVLRWDGIDWIDISPAGDDADLMSIWAAAPDEIFAVGDATGLGLSGDGAVYRYDGTGWTTDTPVSKPLLSVWGAGPQAVFATGEDSTVAFYDGTSWSETTAPGLLIDLQSVWGTAANDVFAVGNDPNDGANGGVVHFDGTAWQAQTIPPTTRGLYHVWGSGPDDVYAVGDAGIIIHYDGSAWATVTSPATSLLPAVWGSAPYDIFVASVDGAMFHYDGEDWLPMEARFGSFATGYTAAGRHLMISGFSGTMTSVVRAFDWSCRPAEVSCGDFVDNDCDDLVDAADDDCADAVRLYEVHSGADDYVEVLNRGAEHANLAGMTIAYRAACDAEVQRFSFSPDAIVGPAEVFRAVDSAADVRARERYVGADLCDVPDGGAWYALCAGDCDLVNCTNVIDYVVKTGASAPVGAPACATFAGGAVDVSSASAGDSLTRVDFAGIGANGADVDWTVAAATRD